MISFQFITATILTRCTNVISIINVNILPINIDVIAKYVPIIRKLFIILFNKDKIEM